MPNSIENQLRLELAAGRMKLAMSQQQHLFLAERVQESMQHLVMSEALEHSPQFLEATEALNALAILHAEEIHRTQGSQECPAPDRYDLSTLKIDPDMPGNRETGWEQED